LRICFLNPFGTPAYDELIGEALAPALRPDADLEVRHLDGVLENIDYYASKHLAEVAVMKAAVAAERDGFDAFVIGCCYDPGLTQAREIVSIPVVGPLEASVGLARPFGHRFAVVTDHHKAVPEIEDRIRVYGQEANCRGVTAVGWFVDDMIRDPAAVAEDAYTAALETMTALRAETVIIGCTIVSACYEKAARNDERLATASVLNPNVLALKQAEILADLAAQGQYRICRQGYYQPLTAHNPVEATQLDEILGA
jgi:allantoin racemase